MTFRTKNMHMGVGMVEEGKDNEPTTELNIETSLNSFEQTTRDVSQEWRQMPLDSSDQELESTRHHPCTDTYTRAVRHDTTPFSIRVRALKHSAEN